MTQSFANQTVLITGASCGLGADFARQLAAEGARLILVARSEDRMKALAQEIRAKGGAPAIEIIPCDLGLERAPRQLFDAVRARGLTVNVLINNAGFGKRGFFAEGEAEETQDMVAVNVSALVTLTHLFLPDMLARGRGGILNVASTASFQPMPYLALYAATKAFVLQLTEALWVEYHKRGIRVLCLCPGNTRTEFHERAGIEKQRIFLRAESPDVVRYGLKVFKETDRPVAVHGWANCLLSMGYRFLPRSWVARILGRLYHLTVR